MDDLTKAMNLGSDGMTLNEYQRQSMRTATPIPADYPDASWLFQVSGFGLGIAGEAGEVADYLKKVIHHEHPLDREKVKKELGDVLWYIQGIAARCGWTLEEVAQDNIDKLNSRYPNGWTAEDSINRKDDDEPKGHYAIPHRCPEDCPVGTRL